ncbi:hypothetical protein [Photorhabdus heterorhabditis]|uniref:hypothetical protein n=1 Tax=Photorhabdus heterorhabditis TaxID=880156 RepID=UPI0015625414|nr:hypothetical protein [Photorhabdus heterorhabditis]NRN28430.1 hypothetical protein [Photorhabdus heterorhabditis subsp. aluminescens]
MKYSTDGFSTPKQLAYCYRLTLNLVAFFYARWHFNACTTFADRLRGLGVTFCRFTAESDAAAEGQHDDDRLMPA